MWLSPTQSINVASGRPKRAAQPAQYPPKREYRSCTQVLVPNHTPSLCTTRQCTIRGTGSHAPPPPYLNNFQCTPDSPHLAEFEKGAHHRMRKRLGEHIVSERRRGRQGRSKGAEAPSEPRQLRNRSAKPTVAADERDPKRRAR